jgi:hypothetical protein
MRFLTVARRKQPNHCPHGEEPERSEGVSNHGQKKIHTLAGGVDIRERRALIR